MMRLVLFAIVLAGCATTSHTTHSSTYVGPQSPAVVGSELSASSSWSATCKESLLFSKNEPESRPCDHKPVRIEVECIGACSIMGSPIAEDAKHASVRILATAIGKLAIRIASTRTDTGAKEVRSFVIDIVAPDKLGLACATEMSRAVCGPEGVSALKPLVYPQVFIGGHEQFSRQLRVNGRERAVSASSPALSLADLFPEARLGDGVAPGTYTLELALANLVERYQVVAR